MDKTPEELHREREQRVADAINLKIPDRVPVLAGMGYFPAKYTGITFETAYYDYDRWLAAYKRTLQDFQPDMLNVQGFFPGKFLELIEPKGTRWPGHGASPYHSHQSIELEILKADEYDTFIKDHSDFMLRFYTSRTTEAAEPLQMLPPLSSLGHGYRGALALAGALIIPEVADTIETLKKAGQELVRWRARMRAFSEEIEGMGFPSMGRGFAIVPFDAVSHSLRGMHGTMIDMHRQPDKLLELCEKVLEMTLAGPMPTPNKYGNIRASMPLTRGSDDFMSLKQFETFYWPRLKKVIVAFVEEELTLCIFFEGNWTARLEYLLELPKGKILAHFDAVDIFRAKEVLRCHICIRGNVPSSLLGTGTVDEVKEYCKKLIDVVGKDGGYILSPRSSVDEVKPENFKAMIEFTKEYGVYN
jgi:hypothetical protein